MFCIKFKWGVWEYKLWLRDYLVLLERCLLFNERSKNDGLKIIGIKYIKYLLIN